MDIKTILIQATLKLKQAKIKNPHLDAEILLSNILKKPREFILAHPNHKLTNSQITNFKFQISRRIKGMPLAYITGRKEFYGLDFCVNKNVLIPRPETELMVDEALKRITRNVGRITLIDVGTGSGCIIITLAKLLTNPKFQTRLPDGQVSNFKFLATDISRSALAIARQNAKLHKVNKDITFLRGNLLEPIIQSPKLLITANLPYLTSAQIKNSPTIQYEPKLALSAGPDGLKYYRQLFKQIKKLIPKNIIVLCEIDPSQTNKIKQIIKNEFNIPIINNSHGRIRSAQFACIKKDLKGLNRLIIIRINE